MIADRPLALPLGDLEEEPKALHRPLPPPPNAGMRILALDCSTRTGWATNADGVFSGVQTFELRRGSSPGMRFLDFRLWLKGLLVKLRPEILVFEQAHHRGGAPTEIGVGFATRVMEVAAEAGIEYRSVHSSTLKLFATGKGNASKEEMVAAADRHFANPDNEVEPITDDNEADAVHMLAWAMEGFPEREPKPKKPRKKKAKE